MERHSRRLALSAAFGLAAAAVMTFGLSGVAAAQPSPPDLNGGTDHFACYEAIQDNAAITISLTDECGITLTNVEASTALEFCNPVAKTVGTTETEIDEPLAHLTFYELTQRLPANRRKVVVNNQFGPQTLRVAAPKLIAVPTVKNDETTRGTVERQLSHFTCYEASGKRVNVNARLDDQFLSAPENILVHAPQYFCSPAEKTVGTNDPTDIAQSEDHFVCYKVTPSLTPSGISTVDIENQFETDTLTIGPLHFLCVPSDVVSCS